MTKRKHRLYLDVTFNRRLSHREAAKATSAVLRRLDMAAQAVYLSDPELYVDKLEVKEIAK